MLYSPWSFPSSSTWTLQLQLAPFGIFWFSQEMGKRTLEKSAHLCNMFIFFRLRLGQKSWIVVIYFLKKTKTPGEVIFSHTFFNLSNGIWFYSVPSTADGVPALLRPETLCAYFARSTIPQAECKLYIYVVKKISLLYLEEGSDAITIFGQEKCQHFWLHDYMLENKGQVSSVPSTHITN